MVAAAQAGRIGTKQRHRRHVQSWQPGQASVLLLGLSVAQLGGAYCPRNPSSSHPPPYPKSNCELFCNGTCPFHPEWSPLRPENRTVYRITPHNVTGLAQKDTGDAGGDAGFYAGMMLVYLAECKPPYMRWGCFLAEQPVITKYILETDGTYGPYLKCNPRVHVDPKTGTAIWEDTTNFDCTYGNNVPYNGITGGCACARANKTVGIDPVLHNMNCTAPAPDGNFPRGCHGVGFWYSTPAEGECKGGERPGGSSGCTWRTAQVVKTINATCMQDRVVKLVTSINPGCFNACPAGGDNITTPCFRSCYDETLGAGMKVAAMASVWNDAFDFHIAESGGCPPVHIRSNK